MTPDGEQVGHLSVLDDGDGSSPPSSIGTPSVSAGMSASADRFAALRSPWGLPGCMARPRPARLGGWPCGWIRICDHFTNQINRIQPSYAFVAEPRPTASPSGNRTLKEQIHGRICNIAELRDAVRDFGPVDRSKRTLTKANPAYLRRRHPHSPAALPDPQGSNITDRLDPKHHAAVRRALKQAWELDDADKAERLMRNLARRLEMEAPDVSKSILEGIDEILTVVRLGLPLELRRSLASTNIIESMNSVIRRVCRNVKRWRDAKMALRWTSAGMFEAQKGFRRIKAYKQLPILKQALIDHREKAKLDQLKDAA